MKKLSDTYIVKEIFKNNDTTNNLKKLCLKSVMIKNLFLYTIQI